MTEGVSGKTLTEINTELQKALKQTIKNYGIQFEQANAEIARLRRELAKAIRQRNDAVAKLHKQYLKGFDK
jgi:hypothetical protein